MDSIAPRQASQILPKAGVLEQMDEFAQGRGEIRLEFQRPPEATDRFGKLALVSQGIAKVVVSLGKIRPFVECAPVATDRFVELALVEQGIAQVQIGLGRARLELQGPPVTGGRSGELALVIPRDAEVVVRRDEVGT